MLTMFLKKLKNLSGMKTLKQTFFKCDSVMCEFFRIEFVDFMLVGKKLTYFTSLFSPYDFKKNNDIILSYFKYE